jgi:leucine dehydrogenase
MKRGVVYAPDYLINAGGVMNCYAEVHGYSSKKVMKMAEDIYNTTTKILTLSRDQNIPTFLASNRIAEERLLKESAK